MAVLVAAIAIYAIGFVIYAMLIPEPTWMAMSGMTEAEKATAMSRMMYSPIMPIMIAPAPAPNTEAIPPKILVPPSTEAAIAANSEPSPIVYLPPP